MDEVQKPPSGIGICIFCGGSNNLNQHKCSFCGRELPSTSSVSEMEKPAVNPEKLICQACQYHNRPGSRYCAICGTNLLRVSVSVPKPAVSNRQPATADQPVVVTSQQPNRPLTPPTVPTGNSQKEVCCPRCLLPYQGEGKVCKHCGYAGLPGSTATSTQTSHSTIPSVTAKQVTPALAGSSAELKGVGKSNITCPVCGDTNLSNALSCKNCGYSFTYRQEVGDQPVKRVKIWEVLGFIVIFIIFMVLLAMGFYYIFTA